LEGLEGVRQQLATGTVEQQMAVLSEALRYDEPGLDLVIQALQGDSLALKRRAHELLQLRATEPKVRQALHDSRLKISADEIRQRYEAGERNFAWVDLSHADLKCIYLKGADLSGADLQHARLGPNPETPSIGSNLEAVNLSGANLSNTDLTGVNLSYANLSGANLRYARFYSKF
jgi:hypothetical protein